MSGFACMECGHKFKTIKAAEKASYSDKGCPKCGGSDIDLARTEHEHGPDPLVAKWEAAGMKGEGV